MGHHISRVECIQILDLKYSNHLNTEHLKSEHLTLQTLFCLVFKWFDRKTRRTIWIHDILDHKTDIFCPVFRPPFKIRSIWQPDMFGPFKCQTCQVFRRLLYISFQKLTRHKPFKVLYLDKQVCNSGRSTMWRNCMQWIWDQGFGFCPGVCVSSAVVVLWCRDYFFLKSLGLLPFLLTQEGTWPPTANPFPCHTQCTGTQLAKFIIPNLRLIA